MTTNGEIQSPWRPPITLVKSTMMPTYLFNVDNFQRALEYQAKPGDIFIATFPKCGTTWTQYICYGIKTKGDDPVDVKQVMGNGIPFIELTGPEVMETLPPPKIVKTHFSYDDIPKHPQAKYIHVVRNPKDTVTSFYHHHKMMTEYYGYPSGWTFDDFFEAFMRGDTPWGDYFDHLLGWWAHKDDPNVISLTYEEMKADHKGAVLKIAKFIGDEYYRLLSENEELLNIVVRNSDFKYIKSNGLGDLELSGGVDQKTKKPKQSEKIEFLRKGVVGDWKNLLSEEQNRRLEERIRERMKGVELPELWKKHMELK